MRKMLLMATVVAASIASTAYATDTTLPLTDPLVGHWCRVGQGNGDARGANDYRRGVWTCDGNLVIKTDGYGGRGSSCTFFDVRRSKDGWLTHADCDDNVYVSAEFKIVGKTLHYRELATSWPENGEHAPIACRSRDALHREGQAEHWQQSRTWRDHEERMDKRQRVLGQGQGMRPRVGLSQVCQVRLRSAM